MEENKLQNLLTQLNEEGVERGNQKAQEIISAAEKKAQEIIASARQQAEQIEADAKRKAQDLDANTRSELKLFAGQALSALKTEVTNVINDRLAKDAVKAADGKGELLCALLLRITEHWAKEGQVSIDAKDAAALTAYFKANAKQLLDKGVKINEVKGLKTDFEIKPAEGGYKIAFGEQEFINYFKEFLRPQLVEMLF